MNYIDNVYPTDITLKHTIGNGTVPNPFNKYCMFETVNAITLKININCNEYPKSAVTQAVKEICDKAVKYFEI